MSDNTDGTDHDTDVLLEGMEVSCSACGTALLATVKFCPECGLQRTSMPVPQEGGATTTQPPDETDATITTGELAVDAVTTHSAPIAGEESATTQLPSTPEESIESLVVQELTPPESADATVEGAPDRPRFRRRAMWLVVGAAALVLAVVAGYLVFTASIRRPVVAALTAAAAEFDSAVVAVGTAKDLTDLNDVADELPGWIHPIEEQRAGLDAARDTNLRAAAQSLLTAEAAFLSALRPLADLEATDLSEWTSIAEQLSVAAAELDQAQSNLAAVDTAAGGDAAVDPAPAVTAVELVIATTTADNATAAVETVVTNLRSAGTLDEIRAGGEGAAVAGGELQVALQILDGMEDATATEERLSLQAAFLDEVATLESLTDERLDSWAATSAAVAQRGDAMIAAMELSPPDRAALSGELRKMRSSIDGVVTDGKRELAQWRRSVRRAEDKRDAELAALAEYESGYRTQMERYDDLRDQTADFTARIESSSVTYSEAYDAFYDGISQRGEVRDAMNALSPPDAVRSSHLAVVGVIDDAIAAMESATDGIAEAEFCYGYCYYADTPGWRRFQSESDRITDEFASATSAWDQAIAHQRSALENLDLPKKPVI